VKVLNQKVTKQSKCFSLVIVFFFFRHAASWLSRIGFCTKSCILLRAIHQPITFSQLWRLTRYLKPPTQELRLHLRHQFLPLCIGIQTLSNETKRNHLKTTRNKSVMLNRESWFVIYPSLTWYLNRCLGQWFFSQYCTPQLRKPVKTDILLLCDGKLKLKQAPAAKSSDISKSK